MASRTKFIDTGKLLPPRPAKRRLAAPAAKGPAKAQTLTKPQMLMKIAEQSAAIVNLTNEAATFESTKKAVLARYDLMRLEIANLRADVSRAGTTERALRTVLDENSLRRAALETALSESRSKQAQYGRELREQKFYSRVDSYLAHAAGATHEEVSGCLRAMRAEASTLAGTTDAERDAWNRGMEKMRTMVRQVEAAECFAGAWLYQPEGDRS